MCSILLPILTAVLLSTTHADWLVANECDDARITCLETRRASDCKRCVDECTTEGQLAHARSCLRWAPESKSCPYGSSSIDLCRTYYCVCTSYSGNVINACGNCSSACGRIGWVISARDCKSRDDRRRRRR